MPAGPLLAHRIETPHGSLFVASRAGRLVAAELAGPTDAFGARLVGRFGIEPTWDGGRSGAAVEAAVTLAVAAWFEGDDGPLAGIPIDLDDRPAWDRLVLGAVRAIPRGETRSYGEVARSIGRPGAARAVGGAVGRNPLALVIPCHRVIAGDGTLGGYGGGWWGEREQLLERKAELLRREGRIVHRRDAPEPVDR